MRPRGPRRSNCLFWALNRLVRRGGYVAFRRSRHSPLVPHFLWSRRLRVWWSYTPVAPRDGLGVLSEFLWFRGHVVMGDEPVPPHPAWRWYHGLAAWALRLQHLCPVGY